VIWEASANGGGGHLSADEVHGRARRVLPELARGTVYKCLGEFVKAGLLRSIDVGAARLYDANLRPHQHFRCRECGLVEDVSPTGVAGIRLDEPALMVERIDVQFVGLCARCTANIASKAEVSCRARA
jgi:Fur family ferric uptake transcriptional regulator